MTAAWLGPLPGPHENCDAPWMCEDCDRPVCPRCEPSPGEFKRCADCDWLNGGAA